MCATKGEHPGDLLATVNSLLERQGERLAPAELLAVLGLYNLMGIISYLQRDGGNTGGGPDLKTMTNLAKSLVSQSGDSGNGLDNQQLVSTLMGLINSKGSGGKQKFNPATLLALVNMLGEGETKETPPLSGEKTSAPMEKPAPPSTEETEKELDYRRRE